MAAWYHLPEETKQSILAYVVAGVPIRFEPRHAATRATKALRDNQRDADSDSAKADAILSLLLVSKDFLTYNQTEGTLLSNATIVVKDTRNLQSLSKRYGKAGLAMIQQMAFKASWPENHRPNPSPDRVLLKFRSYMATLRRVDARSECLPYYNGFAPTGQQLIKVARGQPLIASDLTSDQIQRHFSTNHVDLNIKRWCKGFLDTLLTDCGHSVKWLARFLNVTDGYSYSREVRGLVLLSSYDLYDISTEVIFSTDNWSMTFLVDGKTVICPQRLDDYWCEHWPWLARVNEVELDKYYTF